jgi:hypothetical protein
MSCSARQQIDLDYLIRYTNAPWLVIDAPGTAEDGLFARDAEGNPLAWSRDARGLVSGKGGDLSVTLTGARDLPDGRRARPVFELMAERYLVDDYAPDAVADATGIPADQIRRIAAEIAHVAFKEDHARPPVDGRLGSQARQDDRPARVDARDAGISAHSNGFQTCRMIHVLQILLGSIDCPGGFRYKPPYPKQTPPNLLPHGLHGKDIQPEMPLGGPHLGFPARAAASADRGGRDAIASRQGVFVGRADVGPWHDAHGAEQRGQEGPVRHRRAVPLHGEHGVEFVDERPRHARGADGEGRKRRLRDPEDHLFRRLLLRDGAICRPDPARHDLSGTLGLHLAARPPDLGARHGSPTRSASRWSSPTATCAGSRTS